MLGPGTQNNTEIQNFMEIKDEKFLKYYRIFVRAPSPSKIFSALISILKAAF
jgi:hypothetical protein